MTGTEPHAPRGTAGRGPNWDHGPCAGHAGAAYEAALPAVGSTGTMGRVRAAGATRRRMHISAPPAARPFGDRGLRAGCELAGGAARLGADLRVYACLSRHSRWARAASGPEELRDSEQSNGCRRDAVTVCFQYLVPQVTVSDRRVTRMTRTQQSILNWLCSIQNWTLLFESCRLNCGPEY
jgi:hypothetical protein